MKFTHLPFVLLAAIPLSATFYMPLVRTPQNISALGQRINGVFLYQVSPYEVKPGDKIVLSGSGFSTTYNNISIGDLKGLSATSTNGTEMELVIPKDTTYGIHEVSVSNNLGSSLNPNIKILIKVSDSPSAPPLISGVNYNNGIFVVTGEGLADKNNIITTLGQLQGVSSLDGKTLTFRISDLSDYGKIKTLSSSSFPVSFAIFIQNEHGFTKNPYQLKIVI